MLLYVFELTMIFAFYILISTSSDNINLILSFFILTTTVLTYYCKIIKK